MGFLKNGSEQLDSFTGSFWRLQAQNWLPSLGLGSSDVHGDPVEVPQAMLYLTVSLEVFHQSVLGYVGAVPAFQTS